MWDEQRDFDCLKYKREIFVKKPQYPAKIRPSGVPPPQDRGNSNNNSRATKI